MKFFSLIICIVFLSCNGISKVLKSKDQDYKLRMAENYYAKKKWNFAQQLYEDVIPFYRGRPEFEDIYYKYAYTAYNQKDYINAENLFKTYIEVFPNSARAEEMDFMRAYTFYKQSPKAALDQTNTIKAMGMMQTFINTHPGSARIKEANDIIDASRAKLELKDSRAAQLYFDLSQFRASAVAFAALLNTYPDSPKGDEYKLMSIKSYFRFAQLSVEEKKAERFEKVVAECMEFVERFPESAYAADVKEYLNLSQNNLKNITNESSKTPA
ncbi:MAG TPA: outer membrane protein assembly factor BamD [Flavisolibacter sp.]|nr:outer membrane protein assembly factor BamD [Flavisolibacter sp.]